jgi:hypothetical protein
MSLQLSRIDVINLALAASYAASGAYVENRLAVAAADHELAARLWAEAGYELKAKTHASLVEAVTAEMIEAAESDEEVA